MPRTRADGDQDQGTGVGTADKAHQLAGPAAVAPEGEEPRAIAVRALGTGVDRRERHAGPFSSRRLAALRSTLALPRRRHARDGSTIARAPRVGKQRLERRDHLGAHLEAAGADGRAQRHAQVARARAEFGRPARAPPPAHAGDGAAPAGVHRGEAPGARIDDQRRECSGRRTRRAPAPAQSLQSPSASTAPAPSGRRRRARARSSRRGPGGPRRSAPLRRALEASPIFGDPRRIVAPLAAQVQRVERRRADAARARGEPVDERRGDQVGPQERQLPIVRRRREPARARTSSFIAPRAPPAPRACRPAAPTRTSSSCRRRMDEAEQARVQRLPPQRVGDGAHRRIARRPPVDLVAQQRTAKRRQVDAHLVRPPGLQARLHRAAPGNRSTRRQLVTARLPDATRLENFLRSRGSRP